MTDQTAVQPQQTISQQASAAFAPTGGIRVIKAILPKMLMPTAGELSRGLLKPGEGDVVPRGRQIMIGRVFGVATRGFDKETTLPNGDKSISYVLEGDFEANKMDADKNVVEVMQAPQVYLPAAYALKVKSEFDQAKARGEGNLSVELDVDLGLETTGKVNIPYNFIVLAYIDGRAANVLTRMRDREANRKRWAEIHAKLEAPATQNLLSQEDAPGNPLDLGDGHVIDGETGEVLSEGEGTMGPEGDGDESLNPAPKPAANKKN